MPEAEEENPYTEKVQTMLDLVETIEGELGYLADDVARLADTGLEDDDVVDLLWARKHDRTKSETEGALDALRSIDSRDRREVMIRLVAAYGNMSQSDAEDFVDDLYRLRDRYGADAGGEDQ